MLSTALYLLCCLLTGLTLVFAVAWRITYELLRGTRRDLSDAHDTIGRQDRELRRAKAGQDTFFPKLPPLDTLRTKPVDPQLERAPNAWPPTAKATKVGAS